MYTLWSRHVALSRHELWIRASVRLDAVRLRTSPQLAVVCQPPPACSCVAGGLQDTFGLQTRKPDEALQRQLARSYTALASVLLALRSDSDVATPTTPHRQVPDLPHVPWRDSPLTKWLRPVLTSIHKLSIIATVDPSADAAQDTLATLTYVSRFRTPGPGVRISAPLPGQVEWEAPSRPGSTQPPGRRGVAATGARQPRSASATPRVSTPPPGAGGRPGHSGPCQASQSRWQHPDLTPRSQPLAQPMGPRLTCHRSQPLRAEIAGNTAANFPDVSFRGGVPEVYAPQSGDAQQIPAFAGRRLGFAEPRSPGGESAESPPRKGSPSRKGPCATLAYAYSGVGALEQDCNMLQGSPPRQKGGAACGGRPGSALDGRGMELLAMLRRRGVGVREEALLEQLLQDFCTARDEVRPATATWVPALADRSEAWGHGQRAHKSSRLLNALRHQPCQSFSICVSVLL